MKVTGSNIVAVLTDNGLKLALHHYTPGQKPMAQGAVLYIHGATFPSELAVGFRFDGFSWADDLEGAGFDVWALDFAGFGQSQRYGGHQIDAFPGTWTSATRQIELAVAEIIARTGVQNVSIIAHSWGTIPAGAFAVSKPDLVSRLVMFGPIAQRQETMSSTSHPPFRTITVQSQYDRFVKDVPPHEPAVLSDTHFAEWATAYLATDEHNAAAQPRSVQVPAGPAVDIGAAWAGDLPYDPSQIKCPVCIIRGEWDSVCNDNDARWLFDKMTCATPKQDIKLSRATHLAHLETGRFELYRTTRSFLQKETVPAEEHKNAVAVIFEVEPRDGRREDYLKVATRLRAALGEIDGFISVERFQSLTDLNKILSLSFFENEEAVQNWRRLATHRAAQQKGRAELFANYRLRVAGVMRDYGMYSRGQVPVDSKGMHEE